MTVENDVGFWKWLAGAILSGLLSLFGYHKYMESKLEKKADKHTVNNQFQAVTAELAHQRGVQAKIFDHQRENELRAHDRHERLLEKLAERRP